MPVAGVATPAVTFLPASPSAANPRTAAQAEADEQSDSSAEIAYLRNPLATAIVSGALDRGLGLDDVAEFDSAESRFRWT